MKNLAERKDAMEFVEGQVQEWEQLLAPLDNYPEVKHALLQEMRQLYFSEQMYISFIEEIKNDEN